MWSGRNSRFDGEGDRGYEASPRRRGSPARGDAPRARRVGEADRRRDRRRRHGRDGLLVPRSPTEGQEGAEKAQGLRQTPVEGRAADPELRGTVARFAKRVRFSSPSHVPRYYPPPLPPPPPFGQAT